MDLPNKTSTPIRKRAVLNSESLALPRAGSDRKKFGKGTIMKLGAGETMKTSVVSTGSLGLDIALRWRPPRGQGGGDLRPLSSGKPTLTLRIAEMQKLGGTCAFVDAERAGHSLPKTRREPAELLISQPDTGEQALEIVTR
jgi:recombination protein RecA